ncbi:MAG TPA: carboxylating nicotinate-nucleotide diphosphorylase [Bacteriovoracaceae bacterium]|nr:carboxylating nicotinate-nucleotide diphosphorylase [Bacteriovoracaceae bacterium]
MINLSTVGLLPQIRQWLEEDDLTRNFHYTRSLPTHPVELKLKIKSSLTLCGLDYLAATFIALGMTDYDFTFLGEHEGKNFAPNTEIKFPTPMPFAVALTGERLALNLVQQASSIATWTRYHVGLAEDSGIKILDTRKTTPGLRSLEKYAVRVGGGHNHRLGQTDTWMIKDNHKSSMGGLKGALEFFTAQGVFYNSLVAEIHDLAELETALSLGITHVMLDNFTSAQIREAVKIKRPGMTVEVSGGITAATIKEFLIAGVDAISLGSLTYSAPRVDLSLKFKSL